MPDAFQPGKDPSFSKSASLRQNPQTSTNPRGVNASSAADIEAASILEMFGDYQIIEQLANGKSGVIHLALDTVRDRLVALQIVPANSVDSASVTKQMESELKASARLDHPLIRKVYETGEIDGNQYLAKQYIEGRDLKTYLTNVGRKRPPAEAVSLAVQILQGLSAAHVMQVIHRDLKPESIMLNPNHEPIIMDFGVAPSPGSGTMPVRNAGTAAYQSPEQFTNRADLIDQRSDLYAVGVMLFEMLTGEYPFSGSDSEIARNKCRLEPPTPRSLNSNVDPKLSAVCHKLIAKEKENRFKTAAEAISALEKLGSAPQGSVVFDPKGPALKPNLNSIGSKSKFPAIKPSTEKASAAPIRSGLPLPNQTQNRNSSPAFVRSTDFHSTVQRSRKQLWAVIGGTCAGLFLFCSMGLLIYAISTRSASNESDDEVASVEPESPAEDQTAPDPVKPDQELVVVPPDPNELDLASSDMVADQSSNDEPSSVIQPDNVEPESGSELLASTDMTDPTTPSSAGVDAGQSQAEEKSAVIGGDLDLTVNGLIEKAVLLVKSNQRKEAITLLKRASHIAPKDPRPDFFLGFLTMGIGSQEPKEVKAKLEEVEMHFNKSFTRTSDKTVERTAAANNLALIELKLRKIPAARNYFGIAARQNPRPMEINQNLGRLLSLVRGYDIKPEELKKISALNTEPGGFRSQVGWLFLPLNYSDEILSQCKVFSPRDDFEDQSCNWCQGCAKLVCKPCVGKGKIPVLGSVAEKQNIGFGMTANSTTMGTSFVVCKNCGGSGRVDCGACSEGRDPALHR